MKDKRRRTLVLALGNDILGDDSVGLAAAQLLKAEFAGEVDIVTAAGAGFATLKLMEGYERTLLLDAIFTGCCPPGTVLEFSRQDFQKAAAPSAHYVGLPEVLRLAEHLGLDFPQDLRILALEVENPCEFRRGLTTIAHALPAYVEKARQVLLGWTSRRSRSRPRPGP